jgi:glycosyltransferase involved in cell wall biosynthesis
MAYSDDPTVSVVLPVYNQADHIEGIVKDYLDALDNLKHTAEIVLVVNGDQDGSWKCCRGLAEKYHAVQAFNNRQSGWGLAVRTGLSVSRGWLLCYTNSARTSAHILAMHVMLAVANPGLVIKANRRLRHPIVRRLGSVLYNVQCRSLFDLPVWDVNGTPKVFDREVFQKLDLREDGDLIDLELVVKCKHMGFQILEVPIVSSVRHGGESTTNYASALRMYWGAFRMWRNLND